MIKLKLLTLNMSKAKCLERSETQDFLYILGTHNFLTFSMFGMRACQCNSSYVTVNDEEHHRLLLDAFYASERAGQADGDSSCSLMCGASVTTWVNWLQSV